MVKLVHPVTHELAITKAKLEQNEKRLLEHMNEVTRLEKELAKLRQETTPTSPIQTPTSSPTSTKPPEVNLGKHRQQATRAPSQEASTSSQNQIRRTIRTRPSQMVPRYAKSTQASEAKAAQELKVLSPTYKQPLIPPAVRITIQTSSWAATRDFTGSCLPERYQYKDGMLVKENYGFLRSTQSTANKSKSKFSTLYKAEPVYPSQDGCKAESQPGCWASSKSRKAGTSTSAPFESPRENWRHHVSEFTSTRRWLHKLEFNQAPHAMSQQAYKDLIDIHILPLETRLEGTCNQWLDGPLANLCINDEFQFQLLLRAREVRFEGLQLRKYLEAFGNYANVFQLRQNCADLVRKTVVDVIELRHETSHYHKPGFGVPSLHSVDDHIKDVQKMAIHLYDARRAAEARGLRDELRAAAERTLHNVEALELLTALPFAGYPWEYHHESMFEKIRWRMDHGYPKFNEFPEVVVRIAEGWDLEGYHMKGESFDWIVDEKEGTSQEKKEVTTRRHSISDLEARVQIDRERPVLFSRRASVDAAEGMRSLARI
ncbi:hypothetical protein VP1G_09903 [Cytospora mali]|uniref:Uncharacterized protein n=1 Tax=Cytospora mali TaxID=578113 RepID=A0A194VG71_CYTMA|nr:hypothetical protein VP1G_09903 [Valsa mali var. pyri (nom. inval.)]